MKGEEMRVLVEFLSEELQHIFVVPKLSLSDGRWSDVISYAVIDGKIERKPPGFAPIGMRWSLMSDENWVRMPDCSDEWEVDVKLDDTVYRKILSFMHEFLKTDADLIAPSNSGSHCIDIKHHCSDYFPVIRKVLEDWKTDDDLIITCLMGILQKESSGALIEKAMKFQRVFDRFGSSTFRLLASGNYLPDEEEILQENPHEASLLRGLSLAPPEFPKTACPWTRELVLKEMAIHEKKKLFLGSFEREAIMPKPTNCIEGLNEQAMKYQRVFAHFDSPTLDASASDGKKVIQGNDVYRNNLVQGEENLYQVPPLAPPEFPRIEGPWTRELALAVMAIHKKKKLFLGSFEREAIMPKPTNCIERLNEQAMEYLRVLAHFDSPKFDATGRDSKKVIQGNDVYRNNLVQGEENLYQVPPLAPPEFPRIEGPWTRELALAVMAISASAGYTTPSVIAKAFCAMAFAATATSFWLPGNWKATVRMLAKFGAIACIGGVLAAIGYGLPIECIWVGVLAFLVPAVAVAFS